jgi:hypothetical protein
LSGSNRDFLGDSLLKLGAKLTYWEIELRMPLMLLVQPKIIKLKRKVVNKISCELFKQKIIRSIACCMKKVDWV